jgi:hypothetical protein
MDHHSKLKQNPRKQSKQAQILQLSQSIGTGEGILRMTFPKGFVYAWMEIDIFFRNVREVINRNHFFPLCLC